MGRWIATPGLATGMEVGRPDGPAVTVQNRSIVPSTALMRLAPGTRLVVYHDPADPQRTGV